LNNTLPSDAFKGRTPNNKRRWNDICHEALIGHFEDLKREAKPIATGVVRDITEELSLRDTDIFGGNNSRCDWFSSLLEIFKVIYERYGNNQ
jgi:hypothetical protein